MEHPLAPLRVTPPLLREGERTQWPGKAGSTEGSGHPLAPLRVTPPLLRDGERTQWPGKAGSTGALNQAFVPEGGLRLPGDGVVWLLVLVELLTFGLLFASFAFARWREPVVFAQGQGALHLSTGALNTLLLVGASWCAARAVQAFRGDASASGGRWLLGALLSAMGFLGVKGHEFAGKIAAGFDWANDSFTMLFTLLTGFHFLHVLVGAVVFAVLGWKARQGAYGPQHLNGPESGAVFWHMVDLLWMVLFALVYVIR